VWSGYAGYTVLLAPRLKTDEVLVRQTDLGGVFNQEDAFIGVDFAQ